MQVTETMLNIRAIHKANIENYEKALNDALLAIKKVKECEAHLKELSLNSYKKYKDMEIPNDEYEAIIDSIRNITIDEVIVPKGDD